MSIASRPEAQVGGGTVRGRSEDGLVVFRGIPFAQPPVGEQRFAAPQPVLPWDGVREAAAYGPPPPQSSAFAFATTGTPGRPEYDTEQRLTQLIETERRVTPYPAETTRRIWADRTFNALPLRPA